METAQHIKALEVKQPTETERNQAYAQYFQSTEPTFTEDVYARFRLDPASLSKPSSLLQPTNHVLENNLVQGVIKTLPAALTLLILIYCPL